MFCSPHAASTSVAEVATTTVGSLVLIYFGVSSGTRFRTSLAFSLSRDGGEEGIEVEISIGKRARQDVRGDWRAAVVRIRGERRRSERGRNILLFHSGAATGDQARPQQQPVTCASSYNRTAPSARPRDFRCDFFRVLFGAAIRSSAIGCCSGAAQHVYQTHFAFFFFSCEKVSNIVATLA